MRRIENFFPQVKFVRQFTGAVEQRPLAAKQPLPRGADLALGRAIRRVTRRTAHALRQGLADRHRRELLFGAGHDDRLLGEIHAGKTRLRQIERARLMNRKINYAACGRAAGQSKIVAHLELCHRGKFRQMHEHRFPIRRQHRLGNAPRRDAGRTVECVAPAAVGGAAFVIPRARRDFLRAQRGWVERCGKLQHHTVHAGSRRQCGDDLRLARSQPAQRPVVRGVRPVDLQSSEKQGVPAQVHPPVEQRQICFQIERNHRALCHRRVQIRRYEKYAARAVREMQQPTVPRAHPLTDHPDLGRRRRVLLMRQPHERPGELRRLVLHVAKIITGPHEVAHRGGNVVPLLIRRRYHTRRRMNREKRFASAAPYDPRAPAIRGNSHDRTGVRRPLSPSLHATPIDNSALGHVGRTIGPHRHIEGKRTRRLTLQELITEIFNPGRLPAPIPRMQPHETVLGGHLNQPLRRGDGQRLMQPRGKALPGESRELRIRKSVDEPHVTIVGHNRRAVVSQKHQIGRAHASRPRIVIRGRDAVEHETILRERIELHAGRHGAGPTPLGTRPRQRRCLEQCPGDATRPEAPRDADPLQDTRRCQSADKSRVLLSHHEGIGIGHDAQWLHPTNTQREHQRVRVRRNFEMSNDLDRAVRAAGLVPLRHRGCSDVITQNGEHSGQFNSVEPTERGRQRSATGLAFATRRTWVVAQGAAIAGHSGKNARAHQHGASRPRMPRPGLLA